MNSSARQPYAPTSPLHHCRTRVHCRQRASERRGRSRSSLRSPRIIPKMVWRTQCRAAFHGVSLRPRVLCCDDDRSVNPQVPGSSPGRGANPLQNWALHLECPVSFEYGHARSLPRAGQLPVAVDAGLRHSAVPPPRGSRAALHPPVTCPPSIDSSCLMSISGREPPPPVRRAVLAARNISSP